jgi:hypothetical protein
MEAADFGGYATKAGLKCSDGRTITANAFQHMDGMRVPLVWQHDRNSPENVLGHAVLEARTDGVYAYGYFNDTKQGLNAKKLVMHKDINQLSIYANQLVEKAKQVLHGMIREVSLVLAGANPGALIDFVSVQHDDGDVQVLEDEAVIYTGLTIEHEVSPKDPAAVEGQTLQDVYDSMTDDQKNVVHFMVGAALEGAGTAAHSDDSTEETTEDATQEGEETTEGDLNHQEGSIVTRNVFEQNGDKPGDEKRSLSHDEMRGIVSSAQKSGSLKAAVEEFAIAHGIENIDILFPDAKSVTDRPEWDKRRTEWVAGVLNGTNHTPFSRIKSWSADLTLDQARARGYVKGNLKKEEFFAVSRRITTPQTIYKKQKLDRDDIVDITDFDVVAWMKGEMRVMLDEELARAVLIGDGREVDDEDKISPNYIRPIATDDDLYAATVYVNLDDSNSTWLEFLDEITLSRRLYKGSGTPTFYTTELVIGKLLTLRDGDGRRMFRNLEELATDMRVSGIVAVEVMENETDLLGIMVNLRDYTIGADRGGEVNLFDDFDIDYNQYKYLIETRVSGALTKIRSALVYRKVASGAALVVPTEPAFEDNVITVPTITGVTYKRADTNATVTTGSPITLTSGSLTIYAIPASSSYYFENDVEDEWTFTYEA